MFYTNIDKIALFDLLHEKIASLIRRRSGTTDTREHKHSSPHQKKFGPDTKLSSKDLTADLAQRLGIFGGLCTDIFYSRIRGMPQYLKAFIYA